MSDFQRTRREALLAGFIWCFFAAWTIVACYILGYLPAKVTFVFGMPTWVLWGVIVPWITAAIVNSLFAIFVLADDE